MKKFILILFTVPCTLYAFSQQSDLDLSNNEEALKASIQEPERAKKANEKKTMLFRPQAKITTSSIRGESQGYSGSLVGVQLGVQSTIIPFADAFYLDGGLVYSQQGAKFMSYQFIPGEEEGGEKELSKRMNYLNVPITVRYQPKIEEGFYVEAGIQPGFLLSAKLKGDSFQEDQKENFNSIDVGVVMGAGYKFKNNLQAGIRVTPGITNINKSGEYALNDKHFVVAAGIQYFPFASRNRN